MEKYVLRVRGDTVRTEDREIFQEIRKDIQRLRQEVRDYRESNIKNTRDLAWIKGGLVTIFSAVTSIAIYLVKGFIK